MPKGRDATRPWTLPRFRQMILDCYIEKVRARASVCVSSLMDLISRSGIA